MERGCSTELGESYSKIVVDRTERIAYTTLMNIKCANCKKVVDRVVPHQRFCSEPCRVKAFKVKQKKERV